MGILSDRDIKAAIKEGILSLEPFAEDNLTPNGYDLTVEEVYIPDTDDKVKEGSAGIAGRQTFLVGTKEYVKLSGEITAQLWLRTTYARQGINISAYPLLRPNSNLINIYGHMYNLYLCSIH